MGLVSGVRGVWAGVWGGTMRHETRCPGWSGSILGGTACEQWEVLEDQGGSVQS